MWCNDFNRQELKTQSPVKSAILTGIQPLFDGLGGGGGGIATFGILVGGGGSQPSRFQSGGGDGGDFGFSLLIALLLVENRPSYFE